MNTFTRRGFLGLLASSIAAAKVGVTLAPSTQAVAQQKRLVHARHLTGYSIDHGNGYVAHRIDVRYGNQQWGVDLITRSETLNAEYELAPALAQLNRVIGDDGFEVGEIHSYSINDWHTNQEAQARWMALT